VLEGSLAREPESAEGYSQLAIAYGRKGDLGHADLASAQSALLRGDIKAARMLAARAKDRLPVGSPGWVKSDDISNRDQNGAARTTVVVHPKDPP
jgi:predicted Zn-dependent protease